MPKKTKKQKIEAQKHRSQPKNTPTPKKVSLTTIPEAPIIAQTITEQQSGSSRTPAVFTDASPYTAYFKNDLTKSLMITLIIVCIQVGVYVAALSQVFDINRFIRF